MMFLWRTKAFVWLALLCSLTAGAALVAAQNSEPQPQDADRAKSLYSQGMSALQKGNLADAKAAFEKVVRIVPASPEPHNSLGWVLLQQGDVDPAIAQLRAALKLKA